MHKLYFKYGTMNSSKTANLLMVAHNYESQGRKVFLIKPDIDTRFGDYLVKSRTGLSRKADSVWSVELPKIHFFKLPDDCECVLVDEVQFFSRGQIDRLRELTKYVPVICYGLRTDYKSNLFSGSKRLMEIADDIDEIKTICSYCNRKSIINMKHKDGKGILDNNTNSIELGCEDKYIPVCWKCWKDKTK